jgi:cell division protein FtsW (lipid II flippase)
MPTLLTLVGVLTTTLVPRGAVAWTWPELGIGFAFGAYLVLLSLTLGALGFRGDETLLPITATLCALGLVFVQRLSLAPPLGDPTAGRLAQRHAVYLAIGLLVLWAATVVIRLDWLRRYKYLWLMLSLGLVVATFLLGREVNGARLWIAVGPIQFQPSEVIKVTLVIFLAGYLEDKRELLESPWRIGPVPLPPLPYLAPLAIMSGSTILLLVLQNDLGAALLFFVVFLVLLYVASGRVWYIVASLAMFVLMTWLSYRLFARIEVRVQNWLDPWQDPFHLGYQQIQADFAFASGNLFGSGLGRGQPTRIPAVQTDYIFAAASEELGLMGGLAILALFLLLVSRGFVIALRARDGFARLLGIGLTTVVAVQTLVIVGGVTRLIPLTGITLPFISYGGSSLVTNCLITGLLLNISGLRKLPLEAALSRNRERSP